jgi:hypothetical protein
VNLQLATLLAEQVSEETIIEPKRLVENQEKGHLTQVHQLNSITKSSIFTHLGFRHHFFV